MAEFVEHHKEGMIIEYEMMKNCKMFTDDEIRQTKIKRDAFEYKIQAQSPHQKDFLNYIIYERNQLALIKKKTSYNQEKNALSNCIVKRIMSLYKILLERHPDKLEIYDHFMIFCKYAEMQSEIPNILEKMLRHHRHSATAYLKAIAYESEDAKNLGRARIHACRSIQDHPTCVELYEVFLKIELDAIAKKFEDKTETDNEEETSLDRPYVIYETVKEKLKTVDILISFLNIANSYSFTKKFQGEIVSYMTKTFAHEAIVWHTLAQRVLHNFVTSTDNLDQTESTDLATLIRKCIVVYTNAVERIKEGEIWSFYIDAMRDLNQDMSTEPDLKRQSLGHAYKSGYEAGFLSEKHFAEYIEILMKAEKPDNEYLLEVLESATTKYTNSVTLWRHYLIFYIIQDNDEMVHTTFKKVTKKMASEAFEIWKYMYAYIDTTHNSQKTESFLVEACNQSPKISFFFKPAFLQYLMVTKDITFARKKYREFVCADVNCMELHKEMARLESHQVDPDLKEWRFCYENMLIANGKKETDVWYEYMRFERDFGEPKFVGMLNNRALMELDKSLVSNFLSDKALALLD